MEDRLKNILKKFRWDTDSDTNYMLNFLYQENMRLESDISELKEKVSLMAQYLLKNVGKNRNEYISEAEKINLDFLKKGAID